MYHLSRFRLGFLGCGQMAQNLIQGCLNKGEVPFSRIFVSGRKLSKLQRVAKKLEVQAVQDNEELLEKADLIFLCVKPGDHREVLKSISNSFSKRHTLFSVMAGVTLETLKKQLNSFHRIVRLMPSLSVSLGRGILPFASYKNQESLQVFVGEILKPLGLLVPLEDEEQMGALTVASSSGVAFIFELMEYWLEWLQEQGFTYEKAKEMTVEIFLGASLYSEKQIHRKLMDLQKEVTSEKGVTLFGLKSMRELELERILRLSFEKASLREKQLSLLDEQS